MKKIEATFDNEQNRAILTYFILGFGFLLMIIGVFTSDGGFNLLIIGLVMLLISIIISAFKGMFKSKLTLNNIDKTPILQIDVAGSYTELEYPFKYEAFMLPVMRNQYSSRMYFKMTFYDKEEFEYNFYERFESEVPEMKGVKVIGNSEGFFKGIIVNLKPFPDALWQIYQELEKHPDCKNISESKKFATNSPFESE